MAVDGEGFNSIIFGVGADEFDPDDAGWEVDRDN